MANTLQSTINWALPYIEYSPLNAGTNNEPALSIASMIRNSMFSPDMPWSFNRVEDSLPASGSGTPVQTQVGVQDYVYTKTDFGWLEKASLIDSNNQVIEIKDVYNRAALSRGGDQQQPHAVAVILNTPGTGFTIRFMGIPDQVYTVVLTYQKLPVQFASLTDGWAPIPDFYSDIYNNLFLGESLAVVDDTRSQIYRQRGVAAFLAKAEGLSDTQKNIFAQQWLAQGREQNSVTLKLQQGVQGRGV
jgi:hypothetical protein